MHFAIYLPRFFYAALATTVAEVLQIANSAGSEPHFSYEFISPTLPAVSRLGIEFPAQRGPSRKMDVLLLLAAPHPDPCETVALLEEEAVRAAPAIMQAQLQGATIAAACAAPYYLAVHGLLDGKRATIGWWLKDSVAQRFSAVRWDTLRIVVRHGSIYTSGASFAILDLLTTLLCDAGFSEVEMQVRRLMALPARRRVQVPFEIPEVTRHRPFEQKLLHAVPRDLSQLTPALLARRMHLTERTFARRVAAETGTSPGAWIQALKIQAARSLLETTRLPVAKICLRAGYADPASFSRLFKLKTGLTPGEYRRSFMS